MTYWFEARRFVTVCRREMIAAVVEPVGRKANWSVKHKAGDGQRSTGWMNVCTIIFSIILDNTGVIDIGRKSAGTFGSAILLTGWMYARFQWAAQSNKWSTDWRGWWLVWLESAHPVSKTRPEVHPIQLRWIGGYPIVGTPRIPWMDSHHSGGQDDASNPFDTEERTVCLSRCLRSVC